MTADEMRKHFLAQYRKELGGMEESLLFWEGQPDLGIEGFDVNKVREDLRKNIREHEAAIQILEGKLS